MFKVNRKDAGGSYINAEGEYTVTVMKVEETLDAKGREVCKVTFATEDGSSIADRFINQENVWFRVNQLVAATNHNVPDGTEVDFLGKKGSYANFLRSMIGLELAITVRTEEYESNGKKKKAYRIKNMKAAPAPTAPDSDEEKPF
jgi:hypothetical protein